MLWFKPQSVKIRKELYIEITQENSIEFQVQSIYCYDLKFLKLDNKTKTCIRVLIQENSIENSVPDCLPYILNPHGLCYYYFSLP